ncbi:unnamed protein product [Schistocephalus solidus]|uniref:Secreted protein n=1 Tax=Schistocephalus solidus TaxID=70667 RepID=A0A183T6N8_SCHSO|nr:unnamed protein product [Schistocephalus solidus]
MDVFGLILPTPISLAAVRLLAGLEREPRGTTGRVSPETDRFENGSATWLGDSSQSSPAGINETCLLSLRLLDPGIFG